jgi:hypothetical protein
MFLYTKNGTQKPKDPEYCDPIDYKEHYSKIVHDGIFDICLGVRQVEAMAVYLFLLIDQEKEEQFTFVHVS